MNKLYEYGIKAAEVGKTLIEPELVIPTTTSDKRRQLFSMGTFYASDGPPSYLYKNAAIIDAILELYRGASYKPYEQITMQWGTPGCRSIIKLFLDEVSKHRNASQYFIALSLLCAMDMPDNEDWKNQELYITDWIKRFCNRQSDIKRGKVNIQAKTSRHLTLALVFRSLADHLRLNFDDMNVYRGEARDLMEQNIDSRTRRKLVKLLRQVEGKLHYGNKVREGAREWVRARVLNHSFTEYAARKGQSPNKLRKRIRPFDDSTEYKLHPG